jgi:ubiquinone/menaquinone biosynthesis C-methylase UbiE
MDEYGKGLKTGKDQIKFEDGAAYERYMGIWSRLAGDAFLDWLAPEPGLRWLDVGCGNGAFTEMIAERCAPASLQGIDPSEAQLAFARERPALRGAMFRKGDAQALPYPEGSFDAAVMPLVIFFVPDPAKGVAEMARVVGKGGWVLSYGWDLTGGGFPYGSLQEEIRALGVPVSRPPSPEASKIEVLRELWAGAGLRDIETQAITVTRTFADFNEYWSVVLGGPSVTEQLASLKPDDVSRLQARMRAILPTDAGGRLVLTGRANAVRGRVP